MSENHTFKRKEFYVHGEAVSRKGVRVVKITITHVATQKRRSFISNGKRDPVALRDEVMQKLHDRVKLL